MKLFLTIIQVSNGLRVVPGLPGEYKTVTELSAEDEYVFESLESMNKWLPTYTAQRFKEAEEKTGE